MNLVKVIIPVYRSNLHPIDYPSGIACIGESSDCYTLS